MKNKQEKEKKKKRGPSISTMILMAILLLGIGIMLYPTVSDYWNSFHETRAISNYEAIVAELDDTDYEALFAEAEAYNEELAKLQFPFKEYEDLNEQYYSAMDVAGNGIMGYIDIPSIKVELPIYHGTGDAVLNRAVGHLEGSSLPIGGEGTHAVMSAHRGLPSAKLFSDLDRLVVGDQFTITVLNQVLTYEVDQILIVEPTQMEAINRVPGQDYVTLLTCTPYGVNTHRMLVRGHRVETEQGAIYVRPDATKIPTYLVAPAIGIPALFIALVLMLIFFSGKKKEVTTSDIRQLYLEEERKKREDGK